MSWVLHLDSHLGALVSRLGSNIYWILFAIVFAETGFIVTPFLPGMPPQNMCVLKVNYLEKLNHSSFHLLCSILSVQGILFCLQRVHSPQLAR